MVAVVVLKETIILLSFPHFAERDDLTARQL